MQPYCTAQGRLFYLENSRVYEKFYHGEPCELFSLTREFDNGTISVNTDATLIAATSGTQIEVWLLGSREDPARRIWRGDGATLKNPVVSLKWHPWARMNSGLIVLTTSHLISIYIPLGQQPIIEKTELVDESDLMVDPVGFGFGAEDAPLGPLSVYLGTSDGDVYRLLPYAPPEIEVETSKLELMREYAQLDEWTVGTESWSDERHAVVTTLKRPTNSLLRSLRSTEPLKLSPFPSELYEETTLDLNSGTVDWAADLIVQSNDKSVNFFGSIGPHSDTLVLIASVKFTTPQKQRKILDISPTWVFVATPMSTHVFNISGWRTPVHDSLHELTSETPVHLYPAEHILRTAREFVSMDSGKKWTIKAGKAPYEALPTAPAYDEESENDAYPETPSKLSAKAVTDLDSILKSVATPPFVSNWGANLGSLAGLNTQSQKTQNGVAALSKHVALLQLERRAQARDLLSQHTEMQQLTSTVDATVNRLPSLRDKAEAAAQRQAVLRSRTEKVAENLAKLVESRPNYPPSQAEELWFADLESALPPKVETLSKQIQQLNHSLDALKKGDAPDDAKEATITPARAIELQWRLRNQDAVITSLISRVK